MDEPKPDESTPTHVPNPPSSVEAPLPQPPPSSLPPQTRKRPADSDFHFSITSYFKVRAILKEIRPHFLEVLRTPDFRTCKAANEIQEQMKLLVELYKPAGAVSSSRSKNVPEAQPISGEKPQDPRVFAKPSGICSEKQQAEDGHIAGAYVVGGSAFGWNFITFVGTDPVYYGLTKESFRANSSKVTIP